MIVKDYVDERGIRRRSAVPSEFDRPEEGIPVDVYNELEEFYKDAPLTFRTALYERLWQHGLIELKDFYQRGAVDRYRQALQNALALDATNAIRHLQALEPKAVSNGTSSQ